MHSLFHMKARRDCHTLSPSGKGIDLSGILDHDEYYYIVPTSLPTEIDWSQKAEANVGAIQL